MRIVVAEAKKIADRLSKKPDQTGQYWRVPCPAHGGLDNNLAIWDGENGGLGLLCWSRECSYKAIIMAIEGLMPDLIDERQKYGPGRTQRRRSGRNFKGSRGKVGGPILLYGDAPGRTIVIVEGERTAQAIVAATDGEYTAGTYFKAKPATADFGAVKGRHVIVWADKDGVGQGKGQTVIERCRNAGAVDILAVEISPDWPDKADAADLTPAEVKAALAAAKLPDIWNGAADDLEAEDLTPWAMTPVADAIRLLRHKPDLLLCVRHQTAGDYSVLVDNGFGVWLRDDARLVGLIVESARAWAQQAFTVDYGKAARDAIAHARSLAKPAGWTDCLKSVGGALALLKTDVPQELTRCKEQELDHDLSCMGTPTGVLNLNTGQLLSRDAGRARLITRSVPDSYNPEAKTEEVDALLKHLPEKEHEYIVAALGHALRGIPGRRWYAITGVGGEGKSTLLLAVGAALGTVKSGGYHAPLSQNALVQERWHSKNSHTASLMDLPLGRIATKSEFPDKARPDTGLIRDITGGDLLGTRDVREKAQPEQAASCTIFWAMNEDVADRLDTKDKAFYDRTRILPYPKLGKLAKGSDYMQRLQKNPENRQAMFALLVKAARDNPHPPEDTLTVKEARAERRSQSVGSLGEWLVATLQVTGKASDRLSTDSLWDAALSEFDLPSDAERVDGRNRRELSALARELCAGLPTARQGTIDGKNRRYWEGVKLWDASEGEDPGRRSVECDGGDCPGYARRTEGKLRCPYCQNDFIAGKTLGGGATVTALDLPRVIPALANASLEELTDLDAATRLVLERRRQDPDRRQRRLTDDPTFVFHDLTELVRAAETPEELQTILDRIKTEEPDEEARAAQGYIGGPNAGQDIREYLAALRVSGAEQVKALMLETVAAWGPEGAAIVARIRASRAENVPPGGNDCGNNPESE